MFIVSRKESSQGTLLIVTDSDLLGELFEEEKIQLDLRKDFYRGERKGKTEVEEMMKKSAYLHLTGKAAIALGTKLGLVERKRILYVQKIPHTEVVRG